jgi:hypothetical protein
MQGRIVPIGLLVLTALGAVGVGAHAQTAATPQASTTSDAKRIWGYTSREETYRLFIENLGSNDDSYHAQLAAGVDSPYDGRFRLDKTLGITEADADAVYIIALDAHRQFKAINDKVNRANYELGQNPSSKGASELAEMDRHATEQEKTILADAMNKFQTSITEDDFTVLDRFIQQRGHVGSPIYACCSGTPPNSTAGHPK